MLLDSGAWDVLDRLRGPKNPNELIQTVARIGPHLAHSICETQHADMLEVLGAAAVDGRLPAVDQIGRQRIDSIRHSLHDLVARGLPSLSHEAQLVGGNMSADQE